MVLSDMLLECGGPRLHLYVEGRSNWPTAVGQTERDGEHA